jgi:hypothetical protein
MPVGSRWTGNPRASDRHREGERPDGWIELVVVTQAGKPSGYEPNEPSVNYIFSLYTRSEHLDEDLKVFRTILQTVKLPSSRVKRR